MKKYIIKWDAGFGMTYKIIEAKDEYLAMAAAYELWKQEAEDNSDYGVIGEATDELKEEYGIDE